MTFFFTNIILIFALTISSSNSQNSFIENRSLASKLLELTESKTFFIMKKIILNTVHKKSPNYKKYFALVDDEDYERVSKCNWYIAKRSNTLYAETYTNGKYIRLHNFIMGFKGVDHIDRDGLNCQKHNMRKATKQQNGMNRTPNKNSFSEFKGVVWDKSRNKWKAQAKCDYKTIFLGRFVKEKDAAIAYNNKVKELFGDFAYLNKVA